MAGLSADDLATESKLPLSTIETIETDIASADAKALLTVRAVLEARGILFLPSGSQDSGGPGVRLKSWDEDEGIRPENLNATNDD